MRRRLCLRDCHVYVDEAWREKVGAPSPMEEDILASRAV